MDREYYDTLVEAIDGLRAQGYSEDFNLSHNCIESSTKNHRILHDEFEIDKFFRFEGESNPDDSSILYAISSSKYQVKGLLVNAFGIYSEDITDALLQKFL